MSEEFEDVGARREIEYLLYRVDLLEGSDADSRLADLEILCEKLSQEIKNLKTILKKFTA